MAYSAHEAVGFVHPLRKVYGSMPSIPPQTEAEMRAYCKAWGITFHGPALAKRINPVRGLPPIRPTKTVYLPGQVDAFRATPEN